MKIVAGLGNPGPKYETTRHNAGFLAVDRLIEDWQARGPNEAYDGEVWQATVSGEKVVLVKPQTYMNDSGACVGPLMKFYKCKPEDLIVIYDELDLKPFALRLKTGGGAGGHNGIKSIDQHVGSTNLGYHRVRIGIGHPREILAAGGAEASSKMARNVVDYVLQPFTDAELQKLDALLGDVSRAVEKIIAGDMRGAMTQYNRDREN